MRWFILVAFLPALALAVCPLGFSPDEACHVDSPSCLLFVDGNGDSYCDNPGPRGTVEESPVGDIPEDSLVVSQDSLSLPPPDTLVIETPPDTALSEPAGPDSLPGPVDLHEPPPVETPRPADTLSPDPADSIPPVVSDTLVTDHVESDTTAVALVEIPLRPCPLQYTPEEACPEVTPGCLLYNDPNLDAFCDNPLYCVEDTVLSGEPFVEPVSCTILPDSLEGCPLGLPPEAACPSVGSALCPHYIGGEGCMNPAGAGMNRAVVVLLGTAVLLPVSTCLRRRLRGRRRNDRRRRIMIHTAVYIVSIAVLGFAVQGCYCQLGAFQYLFLPGGLGFLGGLGLLIIGLPMVWALFYGRVFCGWVCPFGALQSILGHLKVPRPPALPGRLHRYLVIQKYVLTVLFILALYLTGRGLLGNLVPASLWCRVDPFHTIYSFFMVGSFTGAVAMIAAMIFFPRFFCKYFCFYGVVLTVLGRARLFRRLTRKNGPKGSGRSCMLPG